jgi:hypothetical protein
MANTHGGRRPDQQQGRGPGPGHGHGHGHGPGHGHGQNQSKGQGQRWNAGRRDPVLYDFNPTPEQIEAFVAHYFDFKARKNGRELVICNPFDGDADFHFNVSKAKGVCHDWHGDEWAVRQTRVPVNAIPPLCASYNCS